MSVAYWCRFRAEISPLSLREAAQETADPHVWLDPHLVNKWVENTTDILSALDPANAEVYAQNAANYSVDLQLLIDFYDERLAPIAAEKRVLITNHDSFWFISLPRTILKLSVRFCQGLGRWLNLPLMIWPLWSKRWNRPEFVPFLLESTTNIDLAETVTAELAFCRFSRDFNLVYWLYWPRRGRR